MIVISVKTIGIGNFLFQLAASLFYRKVNEEIFFDFSKSHPPQLNGEKLSNKQKITFIENFNLDYWGKELIDYDLYNYQLFRDRKLLKFSLNRKQRIENKDLIIDGLHINKYFLDYSRDILSEYIHLIFNHFEYDIIQNSVTIHLRGGDYRLYKKYFICNEDYYLSSLNWIMNKQKIEIVYIVSDDIELALALKKKIPCITEIIDLDDFHSFGFLLNSYNIIISNSTFSWTASYFNTNKNNCVMPNKWIKGTIIQPYSLFSKDFKIIRL